MLRRLVVIALSLVALVGCAGTSTPPNGPGSAPEPTGAGTPAARPSGSPIKAAAVEGTSPPPTTPPAGGATDATDGDGAPALILEAGGLGVVVDETRIDHLPFGTAERTVRSAVARILGPLRTASRGDCGQGARVSSAVRGFELLFAAGRFVGWTDTGAPGRHLTTGDGIGVGTTVAELRSSGTDVTLDRLPGGGGEWTSGPGGLYGRATSVSSSGRVTLVSSGETCLTD